MSNLEMTRAQAMATARRMSEGGDWQQVQIRAYLASRGQPVSRSTLKAWIDPDFAARRRESDKLRKRSAWRERNGRYGCKVLDVDLLLALRVNDGLSYAAISKVAARIYGEKLSADQVRDRLIRRGVPKNPAKVRSARKLNERKATA